MSNTVEVYMLHLQRKIQNLPEFLNGGWRKKRRDKKHSSKEVIVQLLAILNSYCVVGTYGCHISALALTYIIKTLYSLDPS